MAGTSCRPSYRRRAAASKLFAWAALACALAAAVGRDAEANGRGADTSERDLWAQAAKEEAALDKASSPYEDPRLQQYLAQVVARLTAPPAAPPGPEIRVTVLRDRTVSAFAMPDGRLYLHGGLLAQLDSEAQLAAILAHELSRVALRHALRFVPDLRSTEAARAGPAVLRNLPLASAAAVSGYGRELEREAVAQGLERMAHAGYDPREAQRGLERLQAVARAGGQEPYLLGDPARLDERARITRELLGARPAPAATPAAGDDGRFAATVRPLVRENAALELRSGRFAPARAQLDRVLAATPDDAIARVYLGDLYRLQAQQPDRAADTDGLLGLARQQYERAAALDPAYADPFRQLGLLFYQMREPARARDAFQRYLGLAPDAPDARRIREYVVELGR